MKNVDWAVIEYWKKNCVQFAPEEDAPYKIDVFESYLYISTFTHHRMVKMNKFNTSESHVIDALKATQHLTIQPVKQKRGGSSELRIIFYKQIERSKCFWKILPKVSKASSFGRSWIKYFCSECSFQMNIKSRLFRKSSDFSLVIQIIWITVKTVRKFLHRNTLDLSGFEKKKKFLLRELDWNNGLKWKPRVYGLSFAQCRRAVIRNRAVKRSASPWPPGLATRASVPTGRPSNRCPRASSAQWKLRSRPTIARPTSASTEACARWRTRILLSVGEWTEQHQNDEISGYSISSVLNPPIRFHNVISPK